MSGLQRARRALGNARGASLLEMLVTAVVVLLVMGAAGSLWVSSQKAFEFGTSQAYVQRQGTLLQEQIALWAKNSTALQAVNCGGVTTANRSLAIEDANGTIRCVYQTPEGADTDANLRACLITSWTLTTCSSGDYSMLTLLGSEVATSLGAPLRVRNTTFTQVTCIDPGPCPQAGTIALSVTNPLVDVRFELTDNTIPNPQPATYVGMRFGFSITSRN